MIKADDPDQVTEVNLLNQGWGCDYLVQWNGKTLQQRWFNHSSGEKRWIDVPKAKGGTKRKGVKHSVAKAKAPKRKANNSNQRSLTR